MDRSIELEQEVGDDTAAYTTRDSELDDIVEDALLVGKDLIEPDWDDDDDINYDAPLFDVEEDFD